MNKNGIFDNHFTQVIDKKVTGEVFGRGKQLLMFGIGEIKTGTNNSKLSILK